jgi:NADPH:quinone reductase-like Zn-dependent oxidoreductase
MKALIFRETGEPERVLELEETPSPPLAPGTALVRVLLSPINASDLHMVCGRYGRQPKLPASPGIEGVGIVEALGPGVQGPTIGTRVVSLTRGTPGASRSYARQTNSCPFQTAWTMRLPPFLTSIL